MRRYRGFVAEWGWEEIVPVSGTEPGMNRGGAMFTKDGTDFILIGGTQDNSGSGSTTELTDYWRFDSIGKTWTQVVTSGLSTEARIKGFADGSGTIYRARIGVKRAYKIAKSTGTETELTWSGSGPNTGDVACADISAAKLYEMQPGSGAAPGSGFGASIDPVAFNSTTATLTELAVTERTGRRIRSSAGFCPTNNTIYMFAPTVASSSTVWTLGTSDIVKYDITGATGWTVETGVTNNAGSVSMSNYETLALIWVPGESKFFLFSATSDWGIGVVISYDPVTKTLAQVLFDGSASTELNDCSRGNAGDVVGDGSDVYFIRKARDYDLHANPARIWKFRRN